MHKNNNIISQSFSVGRTSADWRIVATVFDDQRSREIFQFSTSQN